jgi:hypothetical protein
MLHSVPDVDSVPAVPSRTKSVASGGYPLGDQQGSSHAVSVGSTINGDAPPLRPHRSSDGTADDVVPSAYSSGPLYSAKPSLDVSPSKNNSVLKQKRLGIRRSMDLSGEVLQQYHSSALQLPSLNDDQPGELKAVVVMETIMAAADIAQNTQSWDHMVKWSNKLYLELCRAHVAGRGQNVSRNWYRNQIGFLELYVLPVAQKMNEIGVFGALVGPSLIERET